MTEEYKPPPSIHEVRRNAPFHYLGKAENARFAASLLWNLQEGEHNKLERVVPLCGNPDIAILEAFRRESAFALESVIKSAVAQRIEFGIARKHLIRVYPTHRLDKLWIDAELPKLKREDYHRLLITTQYLLWAGRYAAPNNDVKFEEDMKDIMELEDYKDIDNIKIRTPRSFDWSDFDRIFNIVTNEFWKIRKQYDLNYRD